MSRRRTAAVASLLTALILLATAGSALAGGAPAIPSMISSARAVSHRPTQIVFSNDGSAYLAGNGASARAPGKIRWSSWTRTEALGSGANWLNNCRPDCAQGSYRAYPAFVLAYRPRVLGHHLVFTRLTVIYPGAHPPYSAYRTGSWTLRLRYAGGARGNYFWN